MSATAAALGRRPCSYSRKVLARMPRSRANSSWVSLSFTRMRSMLLASNCPDRLFNAESFVVEPWDAAPAKQHHEAAAGRRRCRPSIDH